MFAFFGLVGSSISITLTYFFDWKHRLARANLVLHGQFLFVKNVNATAPHPYNQRRYMSTELRNFLSLSYDELEELNLHAKQQRQKRVAAHKVQEERLKYLTDEKRIKAVTVMFSDLEGRLHMLDYDKKFLVKSWDNLTFDGSSIRGFTAQRESDLRLGMDWSAFYWAPADISVPAKCWSSAR